MKENTLLIVKANHNHIRSGSYTALGSIMWDGGGVSERDARASCPSGARAHRRRPHYNLDANTSGRHLCCCGGGG